MRRRRQPWATALRSRARAPCRRRAPRRRPPNRPLPANRRARGAQVAATPLAPQIADATEKNSAGFAGESCESLSFAVTGEFNLQRSGGSIRGYLNRVRASEPRDVRSLRTLSQDFLTAGNYGQPSAWRPWTVPPEGAFGSLALLLHRAVQDRRIRSDHRKAVAARSSQPWIERTCVAALQGFGCSRLAPLDGRCGSSTRTRLPHEDGVPYAEAPSSEVKPRTDTREQSRLATASERSTLGVSSSVASQTRSSSK